MDERIGDNDEPTVMIADLEENMTEQVLTALVKSVAVARDQDGIEYYKCLISDGSGLIWFYANPQSCMMLDSQRINKGCVYRLCRVDAKRAADRLILFSAGKSVVKQIQPLGKVFEVL